MLAVVVTGGGVIGDDHVGAKLANLQHHAPQCFFMSPEPESFVARFRKSKILQAQKVWLGPLNLRRRHRLVRANGAHLFIQLWPNRVLSALAVRRKQTDRMRPKLVPHHDERRAVFIIRMGRHTHHCPRVAQIQQRLVKRDAIRRRVRTGSGPGSPRGQPAWGGGCDRS